MGIPSSAAGNDKSAARDTVRRCRVGSVSSDKHPSHTEGSGHGTSHRTSGRDYRARSIGAKEEDEHSLRRIVALLDGEYLWLAGVSSNREGRNAGSEAVERRLTRAEALQLPCKALNSAPAGAREWKFIGGERQMGKPAATVFYGTPPPEAS